MAAGMLHPSPRPLLEGDGEGSPVIDVFVIHATTPFGLSLSKARPELDKGAFDKLRTNGSKLPVVICESLNNSHVGEKDQQVLLDFPTSNTAVSRLKSLGKRGFIQRGS